MQLKKIVKTALYHTQFINKAKVFFFILTQNEKTEAAVKAAARFPFMPVQKTTLVTFHAL